MMSRVLYVTNYIPCYLPKKLYTMLPTWFECIILCWPQIIRFEPLNLTVMGLKSHWLDWHLLANYGMCINIIYNIQFCFYKSCYFDSDSLDFRFALEDLFFISSRRMLFLSFFYIFLARFLESQWHCCMWEHAKNYLGASQLGSI